MLPDPKILEIALNNIHFQGQDTDNSEAYLGEVTSLLETVIDTSLRAVSMRARNDFITRKYSNTNGNLKVVLKANESLILAYLESKSFKFNQYDDPVKSGLLGFICTKLTIKSFKRKTKFRVSKETIQQNNDNKRLVVRTLSNILVEQIEMILDTQIKILKLSKQEF